MTRQVTRRTVTVALRIAAGLAVPAATYYVLRAFGVSVYLALVISTVLSALPGLYSFVRHRRVDGISTYFTAILLGGLAVSLIPGSTRFLLAREAVLTGVTGLWFLVSIGRGRPLAYLFTKPLLEGRFRWPGEWERLWGVSPLFQRMWRVSSLLFGIGLLVDAGLRVLMAYTLRPDLVPALGLGLYVGTMVVLNVVVNVYYVRCRIHDPRAPIQTGVAAPVRVDSVRELP